MKSVREGLTRRATLQGVALLAAVDAAEKLTDGGYAPVTLPGEPERSCVVLPPGAGSVRSFARRCVGCSLCVSNCPGACLTASTDLKTFGQPKMDFRHGHCIVGCTTCGTVCPAGALERLDAPLKANVHVGFAVWHRDRCIRTTDGVLCRACEKKCPVGAIHVDEGFPVVDRNACIGCGACEHVCPSRPLPAMTVEGLDVQRVVRPMSEETLVAEMLSLVRGGAAIVVARNGVIAAHGEGRGVKPILDLLDRGLLKGSLVVDKVIGRAAASACVVGRARKVVSPVMSRDAKAFLEAHGVVAEAETLVDMIENGKRDGMCPMEKRVLKLTDPKAMVDALKQAVSRGKR